MIAIKYQEVMIGIEMGIISKITTYVESVRQEGNGIILTVTGKSVRGKKNGKYELSFEEKSLRELLQYEHMEYAITLSAGFKKKDEEIKPNDNILIKMKSKSNNEVMFILSMERLFDLAEGANPVRSSGPFMTFEEQENSKAGLEKKERIVLMIQHVQGESLKDMKNLLKGKQIIILLTGK
jgi:hypothetical protein